MRRAVGALALIVLTLAHWGMNPPPAAATTGPYTLPFFDPTVGVNQSYGCTSFSSEPIWSGTNADGIAYNCGSGGLPSRFHNGVDYDTGSEDVVASDDGTVKGTYNLSTGSTCGTPSTGNYVIVKHDAAHYTLYYHLKHDSITVGLNDPVYAGEKVGVSGNSDNSCGAHLHYTLMTCNCPNPTGAQTYRPYGKWTTDPGRVPWLAAFDSESHTTEVVCPDETGSHWIKLQNKGGRTWFQTTSNPVETGRIILLTTNSSGTSSVSSIFAAADWETSSAPGVQDQVSVPPDGIATFSFGLLGNGVQGNTYTVYVNPVATYLFWLDHGPIVSSSFLVYVAHFYECTP